mmetsp:Transcript_9438/g.13152  ORF Transcript_9438/g.13152 Transcript_9438/m.13152 type:complete len:243 (+) Transcript_9438:198-926(+)|eukprot:CAMPEP_0184492450 /NCGR_PEP_ID=MMETSP0113_2-20130426/23280_1 /TAXON_ID=91329 /ORGANISM="Norrisiella sphaerica, Strain BC52" /LENGTH=242 /DNA_ID=CAMNT_0026877259 /DNA_START=193 /DNA_END=921 /DNA_ORIENTATION=-
MDLKAPSKHGEMSSSSGAKRSVSKAADPEVAQGSSKRSRHEDVTKSSAPLDIKSTMKTGREHGQETLKKLKPGVRIEVYWPMEKKKFSGTLVREDTAGQWLIRYDDGDLRLHALDNDNWHYSLPDEPAETVDDRNWTGPEGIPRPAAEPSLGEVSGTGSFQVPGLDHVGESWGKRFERAKYEAIAEAKILQGLIYHTKPINPSSVGAMMTLATQLREFTEFCSNLPLSRARNLSAPQDDLKK